MNKLYKLLIIFIFIFNNAASSDEIIAFLDMDFIMNKSKASVEITKELSKNHKVNIEKFKKQEDALKEEEKKIIAQKNILEKTEFEKKIVKLREKASKYRVERRDIIDNLTKKKIQATAKLLDQIRPILAEYSADKSISVIIEKKNIIIGKSELDITQDILSIVDKKISKIKIN